MEKCPGCGQFGSIDTIALASGPLSGRRAQRCAACERFWVSYAEFDGLGDVAIFGTAVRSEAAPSQRLCRACGGVMRALPDPEGALCCEHCRFVLLEEKAYDLLNEGEPAPDDVG